MQQEDRLPKILRERLDEDLGGRQPPSMHLCNSPWQSAIGQMLATRICLVIPRPALNEMIHFTLLYKTPFTICNM